MEIIYVGLMLQICLFSGLLHRIADYTIFKILIFNKNDFFHLYMNRSDIDSIDFFELYFTNKQKIK